MRGRLVARRGAALVAALALLSLSAALIVGSMSASIALERSARSHRQRMRVDAESWRAIGEGVQGWRSAFESLPIGGAALDLEDSSAAGDIQIVRRLVVHRVGVRRWVVAADASAGGAGLRFARRSYLVALERRLADDTLPVRPPPKPIATWGITERD